MNFLESIVDILFIVVAIALGFLPGIKKLIGEGKDPKKVLRPVLDEVDEEPEEELDMKPGNKREVFTEVGRQQPQKEEYFSYETMSDRDFEDLFAQNSEETVERVMADDQNKGVHLSLDEEEIYKGVVWSEILHRKY